jgi:hypothetical protein
MKHHISQNLLLGGGDPESKTHYQAVGPIQEKEEGEVHLTLCHELHILQSKWVNVMSVLHLVE